MGGHQVSPEAWQPICAHLSQIDITCYPIFLNGASTTWRSAPNQYLCEQDFPSKKITWNIIWLSAASLQIHIFCFDTYIHNYDHLESITSNSTAVSDDDLFRGLPTVRAVGLDLFHEVKILHDLTLYILLENGINFSSRWPLTKNDVGTVEPTRHNSSNEELRAVCIFAGVSHGKHARLVMLHFEVFV